MNPAESLSAILEENAILIARQNLLERVSENPIMNDLFTVINLQAARLLTGQADSDSQQAQPSSSADSPQQHKRVPRDSLSRDMPDAACGKSGALHQQDHIGQQAGKIQPLSASRSASAEIGTLCDRNMLLPRADISRQQGACMARGHHAHRDVNVQAEGCQQLPPIPENDGQPSGLQGMHGEQSHQEQHDDICTPSQNSAEGALVGLNTETPYPTGLPHSSTATSAIKRSPNRRPLMPLQPTATPNATCPGMDQQASGHSIPVSSLLHEPSR